VLELSWPKMVEFGRIILSSDDIKNFPNILDTIRYRIIYLKVIIFDSDTKNLIQFLVNSERLIKHSNVF